MTSPSVFQCTLKMQGQFRKLYLKLLVGSLLLTIAPYGNPQPVPTQPVLCRIMSTEICAVVCQCMTLHTHAHTCKRCAHCTERQLFSFSFHPLSSPLSPCFSYITARRLRPNLHFSSFSPRSVFFFLFPPLFFPLLSFAFQPPFVVRRGREGGAPQHERRQNVNDMFCVEARVVAVVHGRRQSVGVLAPMFSCLDQTVAVTRNR